MVELADIFRRAGPAYREQFGERMLPSHREVMRAIEQCRTEALGGHVYYCPDCEETRYSYHSCRNRHCPKCQQEAAQAWLEEQRRLLLPVPYFLITFTLPEGLRELARSHQELVYNLLFRTSAAVLQQLASDPRFVGGQIGLVGVLQTWTRDLRYHPHVHYLAPAGGLGPDGQTWLPAKHNFLVHVKPLAILFRARLRDALKKTNLFEQVPPETWRQAWVVDCRPVGRGEAALRYLAPYIFRVALSNSRILQADEETVTFRYQDRDTRQAKTCTLPVEEFIRRFLQHVLPKGFVKVRYYGLFSPTHRRLLEQVRQQLEVTEPAQPTGPVSDPAHQAGLGPQPVICCPKCGQPMRVIQTLRPRSRCPP